MMDLFTPRVAAMRARAPGITLDVLIALVASLNILAVVGWGIIFLKGM